MKRINLICLVLALIFVGGGGKYMYDQHKKRDITPPEITVQEEVIKCKVDGSKDELIQGMTAIDDKDGDISNRIMVNDIRIKKEEGSKPNEFDISYVVFDSSNNATFASRTLIYKGYKPPKFYVTAPLRFDQLSASKLYECLRAEDCIDGDITSQIMLDLGESFLNAKTYGKFDCKLSVTNSIGDTSEMPISFEVYDPLDEDEVIRPKINLTEYMVYIKKGEHFSAKSYLDTLEVGGSKYKLLKNDSIDLEKDASENGYGYWNKDEGPFMFKNVVDIEENVDEDKAGTYTVTYSYKHPKEGIRGEAKLIVVVE